MKNEGEEEAKEEEEEEDDDDEKWTTWSDDAWWGASCKSKNKSEIHCHQIWSLHDRNKSFSLSGLIFERDSETSVFEW